jgi:hypothetical protein
MLGRSLQGRADDGGPEQTAAAALGIREPPPKPRNVLDWAFAYRRLDGQPFSLKRHRPLQALYEDDHDHIVVIKPAQRGVSEYAINYAAFALDRGAEVWTDNEKDGLNVAYIFPKKEALGDFSKERLSGLLSETAYLDRLFGDSEFGAVTFKQVRNSYLYLRGGWSTSALKSFPADVLVLDEFDEMAPSAIALARRRLNASLVHRELDISTPSTPGRGIHAMYLESDRHAYFQRHRCGAEVRYDFLRDVRADGQGYEAWGQWPAEQLRRVPVALHCPECGGEVSDDERLAPGRWRAEAPDVVGLRGYWIPWGAFPVASLVRLAASAVNPDPFEREQFFQSDLGVPYTTAGSKVTTDMILQLSSGLETGHLPRIPSTAWRDVTLGVDIGARLHWKCSATGPDGRRYVRAVGAVGSFEELDGVMRHFRVRRCVVDALPELDGAKRFAARWPGRVLRALYPGPSSLKGQLFHVDGDVKRLRTGRQKRRGPRPDVVQVNRTMAMDRVWSMIARIEEQWPLEVVNSPELQAHLTAPTRTERLDTHGQLVPTWEHSGPDHYYHACVYDLVARLTLPAAQQAFSGASGGSRTNLEAPQPAGVAVPPNHPDAAARRAAAGAASRRLRVRAILAARGGRLGASFGDPLAGLGRRRLAGGG